MTYNLASKSILLRGDSLTEDCPPAGWRHVGAPYIIKHVLTCSPGVCSVGIVLMQNLSKDVTSKCSLHAILHCRCCSWTPCSASPGVSGDSGISTLKDRRLEFFALKRLEALAGRCVQVFNFGEVSADAATRHTTQIEAPKLAQVKALNYALIIPELCCLLPPL